MIARRSVALIPVLLGVSIIVFAIVRFVPGDPAMTILGVNATEDDIQRIREDLRLDEPLPVQYGVWLVNVVQGDFGRSITSRDSVLSLVLARFGNSLILAISSVAFAAVIGTFLGVVAASYHGHALDRIVTTIGLLGHSVPGYWLGLLLIVVFGVKLGWLPTGGMHSLRDDGGVFDVPRHLILPASTLALSSIGTITRMTRTAMLEVLRQDYIRSARAKGLPSRIVLVRHALPNAAIPVINVVGLQFGFLLGATVIIEQIFAWPGAGQLVYDAISRRDYPVLQGTILVIALSFVLVNLVVDVVSSYIDRSARFG